MGTGIEWTDETWNPVTGCTKVSPGCDHCYAETLHERFNGKGSFATVTLHPDRLDKPLHWRKPRRVFVNSMSDLFHDQVPDYYIARVFAVMSATRKHTFQVLTKRHARARSLLNSSTFLERVDAAFDQLADEWDVMHDRQLEPQLEPWPLRNVWLGVSVENQQWADIRVPALLDTPAAVRFLSCEPLLGPINLDAWTTIECRACERRGRWTNGRSIRAGDEVNEYSCQTCGCEDNPLAPDFRPSMLDWVIAGAESGPGARPMDEAWVRSLRNQCIASWIPFFYKQDAVNGRKIPLPELDGRVWDEYPQAVTA